LALLVKVLSKLLLVSNTVGLNSFFGEMYSFLGGVTISTLFFKLLFLFEGLIVLRSYLSYAFSDSALGVRLEKNLESVGELI